MVAGPIVTPDWVMVDFDKLRERERERMNTARQPEIIWPSEYSESDKIKWAELQAKQQKESPDRRAKITDPRIAPLERQRAILLTYLRSKLDADDMHGVQDAASDIREIDAKLSVLHG